jgi:competence protein ComEA
MLELDPRRIAAWAAAAAVLALLAAWYLARSKPTASAAPPPDAAAIAVRTPAASGTGGTRAIVDVAGAVRHPGVYRLTTNDRVDDAIERAGGPTRRADLSQLNRAAKLEDGRQILVPVRAKGGVAATAPAAPTGAAATAPIDLNTATLEQLDTLDGVGPSTAQKILDYREQHGGFKTVDELDEVSGIGEKRLANLREHVRV